TQVTWTDTVTSKLLIQVGTSIAKMGLTSVPTGDVLPTDISTIDVGNGFLYGAAAGSGSFVSSSGSFYNDKETRSSPIYTRFSVSYITGSHAFKVGGTENEGRHEYNAHVNQSLQYIFFNKSPILLTEFADPFLEELRMRSLGLYAQDQWTLK